MLRSIAAVVAGCLSMIAGQVLGLTWLERLLPDFGPSASVLYYSPADVAWIALATGAPAFVSGYLTARLAGRAEIPHALLLAVLVVAPLLFLVQPALAAALTEPRLGGFFELPPGVIALTVMVPATILGGYARAFGVERRRAEAARRGLPRQRWWVLQAGIALQVYAVALAALLFPRPVRGEDMSAWVFFLVTTGLIAIAPGLWFQSSLMGGGTGVATIPLMARSLVQSRRGLMTIGAVTLVCSITAYQYLVVGAPLFPYMLPFVVVLSAGTLILALRPPIAIVLTSSGPEAAPLVEATAKALFPHRTVALLDERLLPPTLFYTKELDNLRTIGAADWQSRVSRLVDAVAVIVVDSRASTPATIWENQLVLAPSRIGRTLFVTGPRGEMPALPAGGPPISALRRATRDGFEASLRDLMGMSSRS
jgi:hypothetical protein